ncbi:hypothetical protein D3C76_957640 [compost metagenome]
MHRRQAVRGVVVFQLDNVQGAGLGVVVGSLDALVGRAVPEAERVAANIRAANGDRRQRFAAGRDARLPLEDQQLAVAHLGGTVMQPGNACDEVVVRLSQLVRTRHNGMHIAGRYPAIAAGHRSDNLGQGLALEAAVSGGLATAAHVAGLAPYDQRIRWAGQFHLIDRIAVDAGQLRAVIA